MNRRHSRPASASEGRANAQTGLRPGSHSLWLWGVHPVLAALAHPARVCRRLIVTAEAARQHGEALGRVLAQRPRLTPETADKTAIEALLPEGAVHQGLVLLADRLEEAAVEDLAARADGREGAVIVVLDQVTDPHNVGAILRSAAAFGAVGLVLPDRHAPEETGTLAKAASGALETVPMARAVNLKRALETLKEEGFWIAGLAGDAPQTLAEAKLTGKVALVLGAEGEGLRRLTRESCDLLVRLPQTDLVESLNVSNAAAVSLYELVRR